MKIIPAIDIIAGQCVRLSKGDYNTKKVYSNSPLTVAKRFEDSGFTHLHLVDLDGAKSNRTINYKILEKICIETNLKVDFGGGLKSDEDLKIAFESGASQITGGSIAVKNRETFLRWIDTYGGDKIILGADCLDRKIAISGWLETSKLEVIDFIKDYEKKGIQNVICTDISKDGMLEGPSYNLYQDIMDASTINLIASGGVSSIDDLIKLKEMNCKAAIVGKAIYEGNIALSDLEKINSNRN